MESRIPPTALLLEDTGRTSYTFWDHRLIKALYAKDNWEVEGYPIWVEESRNVSFRAETKIIRSRSAVDRKEKALNKIHKEGLPPGMTIYPKAVLKDGESWPRRSDWLAAKAEGRATDVVDEDKSAKFAQRARDAEERARLKMETQGKRGE